MSLARRTVTSISWNFAANIVIVCILAVRMVLLTRWLTSDIFGIYTLASAITILTSILSDFGTGQAIIHRAEQTENENEAAAVHFTLGLWCHSRPFISLCGWQRSCGKLGTCFAICDTFT